MKFLLLSMGVASWLVCVCVCVCACVCVHGFFLVSKSVSIVLFDLTTHLLPLAGTTWPVNA